MSADLIRVLLVDDHLVIRAGIKALLARAGDIVVAGEAADGEQAVALAPRCRPDVAVMDIGMPRLDGIAATRQLLAIQPDIKVLVLTMHGEEEYLVTALDAGARGYLVKSVVEQELIDAIRALARGEVYVQPPAARILAGRFHRSPQQAEDEARLAILSGRERTVLRLVAGGHSSPEIARDLGISTKTVDTYKQRIGVKAGLSSRPQIVSFALRVGLLSSAPGREGI